MANIYCVIGDGDTRKTSIIRALTGAGRAKIYLVTTNGAPIDVLVYTSSLQEAYILPADLHAEIVRKNVNHVLIPLWIRSRNATPPNANAPVPYPNAVGYLNYFLSQGHRIMRPVVLFNGVTPNGFALNTNPAIQNPLIINSSISQANNEMRESVKQIWGWH